MHSDELEPKLKPNEKLGSSKVRVGFGYYTRISIMTYYTKREK